MNKELLQQYANLKEQEKTIAEEISKINPLILKEIQDAGADKISTEFGAFSVAKRKTWKFSEEVVMCEEGLEELKKQEMANGKATAVEKPYLMFKGPKKEEENG